MKLKTEIIIVMLLFPLLIPYFAVSSVSVMGALTKKQIAEIGGTYQGVISITNSDEEPQEVKVYQTDYLFFFDGKNIYGKPGKDPRSNANWITYNPTQLTIPPKGKSVVNYIIKVPNDKSLVGTYWSMLMVEGITKDSSEAIKPEKDKTKMGIGQMIRYGVQMVTNIQDTGTRNLNFMEVKLIKDGEKRIFQLDIENNGERLLVPLLYVELYNENGTYVGKFDGKKKRTYPGTSVRFNIDMSQVPKGKYKAMAMADCGDDDIFGATYDLECKDEPNLPVDPAPK
jgi:hypothetical protein